LDLARTGVTAKLAKTSTGLLTRSIEDGGIIYDVEGWMVKEVIELAPQLHTHSLLEDNVSLIARCPNYWCPVRGYDFARVADKV